MENELVLPHRVTRLFSKTESEWNDIKGIIHKMNHDEVHLDTTDEVPLLGDIVDGQDHIAYVSFKDACMDPDSIVELLYESDNQTLMGYSLAFPRNKFNPTVQDVSQVYIYATVIKKEYQGHKLVKELIVPLFREMQDKGYRVAVRDAIVENGYADSIERAFAGTILKTYDHERFGLGQQRYFEIDIQAYNSKEK